MDSKSAPGRGSGAFRRIGKFVVRRKRTVIAAWIIALVLVLPVIANVGSVTSLQQGSATGTQLESVRAGDLISSAFARTVPNSSLIIVISGSNVSSAATQQLVANLLSSLKGSPGVSGLKQTANVYSTLYSAISGVNEGASDAFRGANGTVRLVLGVPALYLAVWQQAFASTQDFSSANAIAEQQTSQQLSGANATAFALYSSHVLSLFHDEWSSACAGSLADNSTLIQCASMAARASGEKYVDEFTSAKSFGRAVLGYFSLQDFISESPAQTTSRMSSFAVEYTANATAFSKGFVGAAYSLGHAYDNSSLYELTGNVIWSPTRYGVDPALSSLISSFVSPSRNTTLVSLGLDRSSNDNLLAIRSIAHSVQANDGPSAGVRSVLVTGSDAISYDFGNSTQDDLGLILPVTIVLLIVATGLFFRSALTPFITLGTIGVALGISQVFVVLVGTYIAKVDFTIPTVLLTVLIGVGTDYSVFVIARYREERVKGSTVEQAVETSVTWAGESIATSGATVIISFLSLALTSIVFLRTMGAVVGLGVLVALAVALTLVPAIVATVGGRTFWPNSGERFVRYSASTLAKLEKKRGYFSRSGAFSVKRARALILVTIIISIPAVYVYSTTTPTYDFLSAAPSNLESVSASNHLTSAFGGGRLSPTYVVMTFSDPVVSGGHFNSSEMAAIGEVSSYLQGISDVRNVTAPTQPFGHPVAYADLNASVQSDSRTLSAISQTIGEDNKTSLITVNFKIDPYSTEAISDAQLIRQYLHSSIDGHAGVTGAFVGGASGSILDTKNVFDSQFNSVLPIVAVGVALVLLVVLGSIFLPIFAVVSVLMSIVWTLAATKLVFQASFSFQILFITPFFLFVTLLGLGMDYNVFILTRIREDATKGSPLNQAIVQAIEQTGGIITAAAIILAGSLGALMLSSDLLLKQLGFAFAYSILIDALYVRTYLVPAVMSVMGKWNWYSPIPFLNRSRALFEKSGKESG